MINKLTSLVFTLLLASLVSCDADNGNYFKHSLQKYEKQAGDCKAFEPKFSMISNIIGERYQFQKCLNSNYKGEYKAERKGDTVEVSFITSGQPESLFNITLDINTQPRYNYLTIDGNTFAIIPAGN